MLHLEYKGVYSTFESEQDAASAEQEKRYWLVWFTDDDTVMIQALSAQRTVVGKQYRLRVEDFVHRFSKEQDFLLQPQVLAHAHLVEHEARSLPDEPYVFILKDKNGDDVKPELISSSQALDIARKEAEVFAREQKTPENVTKNLKSSFEDALAALEKGDRRNALKELTKLADVKEGVVPEHKHVFAEFGSDLRKQKLPAAALQHQLRVVELSPEDDHALFNVARVYYDMGDYGNTIRYLNRAIALNGNLKPAQRFLEYVRSEGKSAK
ncbi:tetratricopeptide repeat protein [Halodesulfovibrio marinisediminis]|uniref:Uncharacterized protein n=1 Tax=Halodesulfovibrio marinisediminis DSM 17456 TaxID=1121457 RepID=A0A1N6IHV6_9BACT|nr:tetratricopeptide repeat protein [Halodesulfovibrio marinisediminis]SIO31602.1 hypothetical protein SAMN02745161_2771 [Halodesulfovibrio marinisediminis DSM 17456]